MTAFVASAVPWSLWVLVAVAGVSLAVSFRAADSWPFGVFVTSIVLLVAFGLGTYESSVRHYVEHGTVTVAGPARARILPMGGGTWSTAITTSVNAEAWGFALDAGDAGIAPVRLTAWGGEVVRVVESGDQPSVEVKRALHTSGTGKASWFRWGSDGLKPRQRTENTAVVLTVPPGGHAKGTEVASVSEGVQPTDASFAWVDSVVGAE